MINQHAAQFHAKLVAAGLRPPGSRAEDFTEEAKAKPTWRRPSLQEAPGSTIAQNHSPSTTAPEILPGAPGSSPPPADIDDTDWNQTRRDLA